jgi:PAS domain S-box-containing protein
MAQNKTQQHIRTLDIAQKIVANIDNGIIVLDEELYVYHYNKWLEHHSKIKEVDILNKKLDDVFKIGSKTLKRKIRTALRLQTPTFYTASTSKYLIPIKINQIKNALFKYMQQDVSIIPFDEEKGLVALILTDQTIMANTTSLLETNIEIINELNSDLIKERDTIDKKVLVIKFDPTFRIIDVSQALLKLLNYDKEELLNKNFLFHEKYNMPKKLQMQLVQAMQELRVLNFEESTLSAHGHKICFKSTLIPEYSAKGKHIGFIIFRENITDSKHLAQTHEKILASSRSAAMGEMVAMIAHQWRQPLSLINTIMATLKIKKELNTLTENSINEAFEKIQNTTTYLSDTIDDFRDYFKPNKLCTDVNLLSLFDNSIFFLKEEMHQCEIEYTVEIQESLTIKTFKNELLQSIINIIKNSIDAFSEQKMKNKRIDVKVDAKESHISILIKDNAGGIEKETLKKVFEPYFSTKSKNGTGLGLYMCHTIITQHLKGQITMSSVDNETQTLLELPYKLIKEKK